MFEIIKDIIAGDRSMKIIIYGDNSVCVSIYPPNANPDLPDGWIGFGTSNISIEDAIDEANCIANIDSGENKN